MLENIDHPTTLKPSNFRHEKNSKEVVNDRYQIDTDITQLSLMDLRQAMGMVPQHPILFSSDVWHNIRYGKPNATDKEVETAARMASIHDFITSLPQGYETRVGERGLKLSGGEKQRVAIARTLLKDPAVLVLDEATSALDSEAERKVQAALANLMEGRTVVAIAHRLGTVRGSDRIVVLEGGKVVEIGPHDALLEGGGNYSRMWALQMGD